MTAPGADEPRRDAVKRQQVWTIVIQSRGEATRRDAQLRASAAAFVWCGRFKCAARAARRKSRRDARRDGWICAFDCVARGCANRFIMAHAGAASLFHTVFRRAFEHALDDLAQTCARAAKATEAEAEAATGAAREAARAWATFDARYRKHTVAEDDVLLPTLASRIDNVASAYEFEHEAEEWLFEEVTQCVEALARATTREERTELGAKAARIVHATRTTLKAHLAKESEHVLPMFEAKFKREEQAELVWRFIAKLPTTDVRDMLTFAADEARGDEIDALEREMRANVTCAAAAGLRRALSSDGRAEAKATPILCALFDGASDDDAEGPTTTTTTSGRAGDDANGETEEPARKRRRQADVASTTSKQKVLPIDHIFQFHNALRHELRRLENDILAISTEGTNDDDERLVRMIDGRFVFLRGVYEAHSMSEDDIVFPALEAKSALHNVSHSYTLDHKQEAELMHDIVTLIGEMRASFTGDGKAKGFREGLVESLQQACVAMRVSLETHVAKEESELWPLFEKHFSFEEQEKIVGQIIGRTGAEVLRSMLSWVRNALNDNEREGMISSMRHATQNTRFAQWLNTWYEGKTDGIEGGDDWVKSKPGEEEVVEAEAAEQPPVAHEGIGHVQDYLRLRAGTVDTDTFKPGWEDIFRMNQIQLEDAVRAVNRDDTLAPERKAYLIQNLLASRWIVGNQLQAQQEKTSGLSANGGSEVKEPVCQPIDDGLTGGCKHYKRKCKLVAPCCDQAFTCRFCHDDVSDHTVNRYNVKQMVCTDCKVRQPVAAECLNCKTSMAKYHCNVCNLFDDSSAAIYHCPFCNVCRRGKGLGVDFFHCMKCNACVSLQHGKHECSERGMDTECPVCKEFLAESETPVKELPCGHLMHATCFTTYTRHYYTCPLCRKSLGDFSVYFRMIDAILEDESEHSMPTSIEGKMQKVLCNDCGKESEAKFHFVYHACANCRSYNTRVLTH